MYVNLDNKFYLNEYTKDHIKSLIPQFGYNGFGEFIFYRTYSRIKEDGGQEDWADVVIRATEGTFTIRKDWYIKNHINWDEEFWQNYANDFALSMFKMEWTPPGRGLWTAGTSFVYERGSMALQNCAFTKLKTISLHSDIAWMMDALMLGVGVGFEPIRDDKMDLYQPKGSFDYVIPDSREGWVEATKLKILSYIHPNQKKPNLIYDLIRGPGLLIKGFGGISSGPKPLIDFHKSIDEEVERFKSRKEYDSVYFKTNLANQVGFCVVAGNLRRCLPKTTIIGVNDGLKNINEIKVNDSVLTLNGYKKVTNVFNQGLQNLYRVYLSNGRWIDCTKNHKFAVLDNIVGDIDWVEAQYLKETDILLVQQIPCKGKPFDVEKAYFYGILNGDGHIHDRRNAGVGTTLTIVFSSDEIGNKISEKIFTYLDKECLNPRLSVQKNTYHYIRVYNTEYALSLLKYKIPKQAPVIPEEIFSASIEARSAYLAGICDSDGTHKNYILCNSKYPDFLRQVQRIATSLGINTVIRTRKGTILKGYNDDEPYADRNELNIIGYISKKIACKLINKFMIKQFPERIEYRNDNYIFKDMLDKAKEENLISLKDYQNLNQARNERVISHKNLIDFYPDFWSKVYPIQVTDVINLEIEEETWDIEVEEDHCFFAEGILVHNSAELAKGKLNDPVFPDLKDYKKFPEREAYGWLSNNSVALETDEDFQSLGEIAKRVITRGEPGYINLKNFPYARIGKRMKGLRKDKATGINPCQPNWAKVLTPNGIRQFKDINIGDLIWSETGWTKVLNKWSNGINKVYKFTTTAGIFYGTEHHNIVSDSFKIPIKDAISIDILKGPYQIHYKINPDDIISGLLIGDGTVKENEILLNIGENDQEYFKNEYIYNLIQNQYSKNYEYKVLTSLKKEDLPYTYLRKVPEKYLYGNKNIVSGFLYGLFSANGSICGNRITLKASSKKLIEDVQMMLSSLGIKSYYTTNKSKIVEFSNGKYVCKESYDLNISENREEFLNVVGFIQKYKMEKLFELIQNLKRIKIHKSSYEIISQELISEEEVFDITVDNYTHTYWSQGCNVSNCGEQILEDKECCTLAETMPTVCKDQNIWLKSCEYATFYASTVTLLSTHQPETNKVMCRNRRIGIGIIDWTGWKHENGMHKVIKYMREGYDYVRKINNWTNDEAGIPRAIRVTTVKPSGTVSKLPGKTPGCGYPTFDYTIRRVRVAKNHPIHELLENANVPFEEDYFDQYTDVFEWPILQGPAESADKITLWEQAFNLVTLQREWSDNAVSNTLYFKPMWPLVHCIEENFIDTLAQYVGQVTANLLFIGEATEYIIPERYKVIIKRDEENECIKILIYEYDPKHEEKDIESVLSAIAPLTKSVSLLPHSPKGAYRQMPEEGISEEEYYYRLSKIEKIDWSQLSGSDGQIQDDLYCTGESCTIIKG